MSLKNVFGEGGGGRVSESGTSSQEVMPSFTTMQLPTPLLKYGQQGNDTPLETDNYLHTSLVQRDLFVTKSTEVYLCN